MFTKDYPVHVKAIAEAEGKGVGTVKMLVSVFGNVDSYGDMVMPGAFTDSLAKWMGKGDPIPFVWSHQWGDPFAIIGSVTKAAETEAGLEVDAEIDLDTAKGKQVYGLLKKRLVTQASFAYDIDEAEFVEHESPDGGKYMVYELRKLSILEAGPCLLGANRDTELLEAKAHELMRLAKAGQPLSPQTRTYLAKAQEHLGAALAEQTPGDQPEAPSGETTLKSAQARARLALTFLEGDNA